jgi:hypothetical protein
MNDVFPPNTDPRVISDHIEKVGFALIQGLFPVSVIDAYLSSCEAQMKNAPRLEGKNYRKGVTPNYVQPWMIDAEKHMIASTRLYEFYHNELPENTKHIIDTVLLLRDAVEKKWPEIEHLNQERKFEDYNIIAKYEFDSGYQSKHSDLDPKIPHPTVQCQLLLTQYGDDYEGGHLRMYSFDGRVVEIHTDVPMNVGDLLLFDKRLPHDVSTVIRGHGRNRHRWMALIGAKTFPREDSRPLRDLKIKARRYLFLHYPAFYSRLRTMLGKGHDNTIGSDPY